MIRLLRCIKKRHDISDMDFRRYWDASEYASIFEAYMNVSEGISYQKNLVLKMILRKPIILTITMNPRIRMNPSRILCYANQEKRLTIMKNKLMAISKRSKAVCKGIPKKNTFSNPICH